MPTLPTLHLIAPFFATVTDEWSHDGFVERTRTFSKMMQALGYRVVEYAAEGSESEAGEKVSVMDRKEHIRFFPPMKKTDTRPATDTKGQGFTAYSYRLAGEMAQRVQPGDIVCHVFGDCHRDLVTSISSAQHVEIGVGYASGPFGAWRIFDSHAWRHFHWGRDDKRYPNDKGANRLYSWVIPNPHDPAEFPVGPGGESILYFGRLDSDKGMPTIVEIIREHALMVNEGLVRPLKFVFGGYGDFDRQILREVHKQPNPMHKPNGVEIEYLGPVPSAEKAKLLGSVRCLLAPTSYVEPLHNVSLQAMMTGTPVVSSDFGCFPETIIPLTGFRCQTLGDWIHAIDKVKDLNRIGISHLAKIRFSTDVCGKLYEKAFMQIADLNGTGWRTRTSHRPELA